MYLTKKTSKLQGSFCPKIYFIEFYMTFKFFLSESFSFDTGKIDLRSNPFQEGGNDAHRLVDPGQDDATMVETDVSSTKDKQVWINGEHTDLKPAEVRVDELSDTTLELDELRDITLEVSELSDTGDGAGLAAERNGPFSAQRKVHK